MRIVFLGLNYPPEEISTGLYSGGLCEALAERGHDVRAVVAKPYYPAWRVFDGYRGLGATRGRERGVDVTRVPLYVPAVPTGLRRILHYLSFALSAALPVLARALRARPDMVITVAPTLVAAPLAWAAARLTGARCWLHIQDFEVGAAFATDLMSGGGAAARLARWYERRVVNLFDVVSSISHEMCGKVRSLGVPADRVYEFRNWSDVDSVRPLTGPSPYRAEWGIEAPHVALYSGNIANKQGIEILVEAARLLRHRRDLVFVICGEGPNRDNLERAAAGLANIVFRGLQPIDRLGDLLGLATIHLLPQKASAADLVLPSKLTNMLASGRPVVATAQPGTGLAREVEGCGIVTPPEDAAAFAEAIEALLDDPALHSRLSAAARDRALAVWAKDAIIAKFAARLSAP